jgi:hypothetical protein
MTVPSAGCLSLSTLPAASEDGVSREGSRRHLGERQMNPISLYSGIVILFGHRHRTGARRASTRSCSSGPWSFDLGTPGGRHTRGVGPEERRVRPPRHRRRSRHDRAAAPRLPFLLYSLDPRGGRRASASSPTAETSAFDLPTTAGSARRSPPAWLWPPWDPGQRRGALPAGEAGHSSGPARP